MEVKIYYQFKIWNRIHNFETLDVYINRVLEIISISKFQLIMK